MMTGLSLFFTVFDYSGYIFHQISRTPSSAKSCDIFVLRRDITLEKIFECFVNGLLSYCVSKNILGQYKWIHTGDYG